eukprot:gene26788-35475_t
MKQLPQEMKEEAAVHSISSFNSFIGNALNLSISCQEVIDSSAYGLLSNADTASASRSYRKIEEILNALYRRGADHGKIIFNVNNLSRTASTVPALSSSSLQSAEKEAAKESAVGDTDNQNITPKKLKPIKNDYFSPSTAADANQRKSPSDESHVKKDRIINSSTSSSNSIISKDAVDFHVSINSRPAHDSSIGNNSMSGASLAPRTNTSTLRPVATAQRYHQHQHPSLQQSQATARDNMSLTLHNQDYKKPIDTSPSPYHSAMATFTASNSRMPFPVPFGRMKGNPMVKKHADRYVPSTSSKPKQKRKIQQLDHPQIQPHRVSESLQPSQTKFKGVETISHDVEEAITNTNPAKKLRGMPVKQPKVITMTTITEHFVKLPIHGRIIKLGPFENMVSAANAHDRAMIRLKGPSNCDPIDLNFDIQLYAKDPLETFHQFDSSLRSQIFGTNYQLQAVDFSYLLAQSRHLYSNTYTAPYSMSVPVVQDRIDTSTIGAHSHSYSQRYSNKPVNYRSSSSSYNGNHDAENKQGGDLNALISKSLNSITSSSSSSIYSALKATSCLMVDVQRTSVNMPASKVQRLPFWNQCSAKDNHIQRDVGYFSPKFSQFSDELRFCKLRGIVLMHSREESLLEPSSSIEAKFTVIPEQQYSQEDCRFIGIFLRSPKNFTCGHVGMQTAIT